MSNEHDPPTDPRDAPSTTTYETHESTPPGPDLLTERSIVGILVHLLTFFASVVPFGFVVSGVIYLLSSNEFTRENARNAFNWYLFVTITLVVFAIVFFTAVAIDSLALPGVVEFVVLVPVFLFALVGILLFSITLACSLVATGKAIFGTAWEYPLTPDFVAYIGRKIGR